MATKLADSMPIVDNKHYQGGSVILMGSPTSPPAWPTVIEDIIDLATGALETGWTYMGPLDNNGAELSREWDRREGQPTDQRSYNLRRGKLNNWRMALSGTSLYTDSIMLKTLWGLGTQTDVAAVADTNVAQKRTNIGAPSEGEERMWAILQQDENTRKLHVDVFRKGIIVSAGPVRRNAENMAVLPFNIGFEPDSSITDGTTFGIMLETTSAVLI